jgi:hypothetical protein
VTSPSSRSWKENRLDEHHEADSKEHIANEHEESYDPIAGQHEGEQPKGQDHGPDEAQSHAAHLPLQADAIRTLRLEPSGHPNGCNNFRPDKDKGSSEPDEEPHVLHRFIVPSRAPPIQSVAALSTASV